MSEQEHVNFLLGALFKKEGGWWKAATVLLAIPMLVGALVATVTYTFVGIAYIQGLNFAKESAPVTIAAVREVRDSLRQKEGFVFVMPIPK